MFTCLYLPGFPVEVTAGKELQARLLEVAGSLGPDCEQVGPGVLIVDLSSIRIPEIWCPGIPGLWVALAGGPELALLAAVASERIPRRGRAFASCSDASREGVPFPVAPMSLSDQDALPLGLLPAVGVSGTEEILPLLRLWGLRTLGDFRRLPRQDVAERIGPQAMRLHDVLHGKNPRLLQLHRPSESFALRIDFDDPVDSLEVILFHVKRALDTLCARLESRHLAAGCVRFNLLFESSAFEGKSVALPEPLGSPLALLKPVQAVLEALRVASPVVGLEVELEPVKAFAAQREWFGRQLRQPERWADTLGRLETLLGAGRVGVARVDDSHRPDAFQMLPVMGKRTALAEETGFPVCALPLRRFRPPLEVAVASTVDGGRPRPQALLTGPQPGAITRKRGPFPVSGDWWSPEACWRRLEWDIETESRHLFRLAFIPPDLWQLDGAY